MGMVAAPSLLPRSGGSSSKQKTEKTRYSDRQRRQRVADNLKALHELLPNPEV
ncbi:transcription factor bHLH66, partial [Trifolium medium]|nr:transcription factor bHLH66 [Trifolium medium]